MSPAWSVFWEYFARHADAVNLAACKDSRKFEMKHRGDVLDALHAAIGAAYGDVFTCDQRAAKLVGAGRVAILRMPCIAGNDIADALRGQIKNLLGHGS